MRTILLACLIIFITPVCLAQVGKIKPKDSVEENAALTQYLVYVDCPDSLGSTKETSSRITHTWVKEGLNWKLLGGMSSEK